MWTLSVRTFSPYSQHRLASVTTFVQAKKGKKNLCRSWNITDGSVSLKLEKPEISTCVFIQACSVIVFIGSQLLCTDLLLSQDFYFMMRLKRSHLVKEMVF